MKRLFTVLLLFLLVTAASAAITTNAATDISQGKVTMNGNHAGAGIAYFKYGTSPERFVYRTENQSVNGAYTATVNGWPLMLGKTYYFMAIDAEDSTTGSTLSFSLTATTPVPTSTFGNTFTGLKRNKLNISASALNITEPYANVFGGGNIGLAIFIGLFYAIVLGGMLIFMEDVILPVQFGVLLAAAGIYALLPPEFQTVAYTLTVMAIAGIAYVWIRGWRK